MSKVLNSSEAIVDTSTGYRLTPNRIRELEGIVEIRLDLDARELPRQERELLQLVKKDAQEVHRGRYRKTGGEFFRHIDNVAGILYLNGAGIETVIGGLHHDTIEDDPEVKQAVEKAVKEITSIKNILGHLDESMGSYGFVAEAADYLITTLERRGKQTDDIKNAFDDYSKSVEYLQHTKQDTDENTREKRKSEEEKARGILNTLIRRLYKEDKTITDDLDKLRTSKFVTEAAKVTAHVAAIDKDYFFGINPHLIGDLVHTFSGVTRNKEKFAYYQSNFLGYNTIKERCIRNGIQVIPFIDIELGPRVNVAYIRRADRLSNSADTDIREIGSSEASRRQTPPRDLTPAEIAFSAYKTIIQLTLETMFYLDNEIIDPKEGRLTLTQGKQEFNNQTMASLFRLRNMLIDMNAYKIFRAISTLEEHPEYQEEWRVRLDSRIPEYMRNGVLSTVTIDRRGTEPHNNYWFLTEIDKGKRKLSELEGDTERLYTIMREFIGTFKLMKRHPNLMIEGIGYDIRGIIQ